MFERFTESARQVVVLAQDEARALRHNYIGTEHLLLGLAREPDGHASTALTSLGVELEGVRHEVEKIVGAGDEQTTGQIPFTPRAKKVLELALRESLAARSDHIGTEHLLLGLTDEGKGVAMRILGGAGVDANAVRGAVGEALGQDAIPPLAPMFNAFVPRFLLRRRR